MGQGFTPRDGKKELLSLAEKNQLTADNIELLRQTLVENSARNSLAHVGTGDAFWNGTQFEYGDPIGATREFITGATVNKYLVCSGGTHSSLDYPLLAQIMPGTFLTQTGSTGLASSAWAEVIWSELFSRYIALSTTSGTAVAAHSADGATWSAFSMPEAGVWADLVETSTAVWARNTTTGKLAKTTNGTSWTLVTPSLLINKRLRVSNDKLLMAADAAYYTSTDGVTWSILPQIIQPGITGVTLAQMAADNSSILVNGRMLIKTAVYYYLDVIESDCWYRQWSQNANGFPHTYTLHHFILDYDIVSTKGVSPGYLGVPSGGTDGTFAVIKKIALKRFRIEFVTSSDSMPNNRPDGESSTIWNNFVTLGSMTIDTATDVAPTLEWWHFKNCAIARIAGTYYYTLDYTSFFSSFGTALSSADAWKFASNNSGQIVGVKTSSTTSFRAADTFTFTLPNIAAANSKNTYVRALP